MRVELGLFAAQLGDGLLAVDPLARDAVPVGACAQLGEHRQGEHLHAPAEQVLGAHVLVAHVAEVAAAGVGALDHHLGGDLRGQRDHLVGRVPPDRVRDERQQLLGVHPLGLRQEARLRQQRVQRLRVVLDHRALGGQLQFHRRRVEALEEAEVEERYAPVLQQHEVAGVGVAGELVVAVEAAEEEAEHDLPDAVALGLRVALQLLEAHPLHELAHEHALARELGDHVGDLDERVPVEDARQRALVLGLQLVVELLADPLLDLRRDRAHVELGGHPLEQAHDHVQVLQVRSHRRRDPGVLDLHRDLAAVLAQPRAVHLADRGRRDRLLLELLEHRPDALPEVVLDHPPHLLEGHRRRRVAELRQLRLELLAVLLLHEAHVQEGHHLAELHRRALHRAQHRDDLLRGLHLAARQRLLAGLLAARHVGGARAELLHGLGGRQLPHRSRAAHSGCRDVLLARPRLPS